ncbi:MAG TPA: phosphatase PAP2 family protein [Acidimicrobiales bacterium]
MAETVRKESAVTGYERRAWDGWVLLGAVVVFLPCLAVARTKRVPGWERAVFHGINGLPQVLYRPMWLMQLVGLLLVPLVVAVVAAVLRRWRLAVCLVAFIPLKLAVEKLVVKKLVERQRPGTSICAGNLACGHFRGVPIHGLSFVSGHAVISFGVATLLAPYLTRRWQVVAYGVAMLNITARVYLGAHNPLDVVGGAAAGVAIASVLNLIAGVPIRASAPADRSG